jgi:hypothetical protein
MSISGMKAGQPMCSYDTKQKVVRNSCEESYGEKEEIVSRSFWSGGI